jgi:hypothetical protein
MHSQVDLGGGAVYSASEGIYSIIRGGGGTGCAFSSSLLISISASRWGR